MNMKRGSDGRPVNVPLQRRESNAGQPASAKRRHAPKLYLDDDSPTVLGGDREKPPSQGKQGGFGLHGDDAPTGPGRERRPPPEGEDQPTDLNVQGRSATPDRQVEPRKSRESGGEEPTVRFPGSQTSESADQSEPSERVADLPTGWLVIVEGPGKGTTLPIGYGHNQIGRGAGMRIRLNFGDNSISREHTAIRYSDRNNTFHILPGKNNVYLAGDEEVLVPTRLNAGSLIELGKTTLRFVPFCDDSFRWS